MQTNDVLRRLRYALNLRDADVADMMNQAGEPRVTPLHVTTLLLPDDHEDQEECSFDELERALDGLILARRGPSDPDRPTPPRASLTNNAILKKLRIAMSFKQQDMLDTLTAGGMTITPPELSALFRKPTHKHFRPCGDQLLRYFLVGLARRERA